MTAFAVRALGADRLRRPTGAAGPRDGSRADAAVAQRPKSGRRRLGRATFPPTARLVTARALPRSGQRHPSRGARQERWPSRTRRAPRALEDEEKFSPAKPRSAVQCRVVRGCREIKRRFRS
jgi:hypothetical protein